VDTRRCSNTRVLHLTTPTHVTCHARAHTCALSLPPDLIRPNSAAASAHQRSTRRERRMPASGPRVRARRRARTRRARAAAAGTSSGGASAHPAARPRPPGRRPCPWRRSQLRGVGKGYPTSAMRQQAWPFAGTCCQVPSLASLLCSRRVVKAASHASVRGPRAHLLRAEPVRKRGRTCVRTLQAHALKR